MSLKTECVDMIRLITDPLKIHEYDYYETETDTHRTFCNLSGEDITYCGCEYCDKCSENCEHKVEIKVDVSFYDCGDIQRNYLFSKEKITSCNGVTYIRSRKKLMSEMFKLKKELEDYKDYCATFGEKYSEYMEYTKSFVEQVINDFKYEDGDEYSLFAVDTDILPIVFHTDYRKDMDWNSKIFVGGDFHSVNKQSIINIYCCMDNEDAIKKRIRHEILHYALYMSNLQYGDDTALFHIFCKLYDANAYMELQTDEQELYEKLEIALDRMSQLYKAGDIAENIYRRNVAILLYGLGSLSEENTAKETAKILLEACNKEVEKSA